MSARAGRTFWRLSVAALAALLLTAGSAPAAHGAQKAGVQLHLMWSGVDTAEMDRQLAAAKAAGAGVVRIDVSWAGIEPVEGERSAWYLSRLDHAVDSANAKDLDVLLTWWETPCWASSAPETAKQGCSGAWWDRKVQLHPPTDANDYARGLAFVAKRYGSRVRAWELWNEPNSSDYFRSENPARDYAALVKAAYPAAKAVAPATTIVAGSLMWADAGFTRKLYDEGIEGCFDAFSIHPYSDDRSPLDPGDDAYVRGSFVRGVPAVRKVMVDENNAKPLWLTEFGWNTSAIRGSSPWLNGVSEATQAAYILDAYEHMPRWSYVEVGVYFNLLDTAAGDMSYGHFGLTRADRSAKPALAAFRRAAQVLDAGAAPPAQPAASAAAAGAPQAGSGSAAVASAPSTAVPHASTSRAPRARAAAMRYHRRMSRRQAAAARRAVARCRKSTRAAAA